MLKLHGLVKLLFLELFSFFFKKLIEKDSEGYVQEEDLLAIGNL